MNKTCTFSIDAETFGMLTPSGSARKEHLVTVSSIPPIIIHTPKSALINRIRIYGNTANNSGVGNPSSNLAHPIKALPYTIYGVTMTFIDDIYTISGTRTGLIERAFSSMTCEANTNYTVRIIPELRSKLSRQRAPRFTTKQIMWK